MRKIEIKTDLSIISNNHQIHLKSNNRELVINIIGESVLYIPFKQLLHFYKLKTKSKFIDQSIIIQSNEQKVVYLNNGKLKIHNFSIALKFIWKSLFR